MATCAANQNFKNIQLQFMHMDPHILPIHGFFKAEIRFKIHFMYHGYYYLQFPYQIMKVVKH